MVAREILVAGGGQAVLFDAEHAAGLQRAEGVGEDLVGIAAGHPVVHVAEGEHGVGRAVGREARAGARGDGERDVAIGVGTLDEGRAVGVDIRARAFGGGGIDMGGVELAAAALQVGPEDGGVPAAAGRDFDDGVGGLYAEEGERLDGMAPFVARLFLLEAPGAGNRGFQRGCSDGGHGRLARCRCRCRNRLAAAAGGKTECCKGEQQMACFHVFS